MPILESLSSEEGYIQVHLPAGFLTLDVLNIEEKRFDLCNKII